jgi:hypothetical protein
MALMASGATLKALNLGLVFAIPPVVFLLVAATYVFTKEPLDAIFAFTVRAVSWGLCCKPPLLDYAMLGGKGKMFCQEHFKVESPGFNQ